MGPSVSKSVYAIDGDTTKAGDPIIAGHTITYRISFPMPTADFENLVLTDFLPLPIYSAAEVTGFVGGVPSATPPPAGMFSYGPGHTLNSAAPSTDPPTLLTDPATNSVSSSSATLTSSIVAQKRSTFSLPSRLKTCVLTTDCC